MHRPTLAVNVVRSAAAAAVPATVKLIMVTVLAEPPGPSAGMAPVTVKVPARRACHHIARHVIGCRMTQETRRFASRNVLTGCFELELERYVARHTRAGAAHDDVGAVAGRQGLPTRQLSSSDLAVFVTDATQRIPQKVLRLSREAEECKALPGAMYTVVSARGVAAQVEFESKIDAKLKAVYHILVSSA